jgi:effector-binding domain-containing protein
MTDSQIVELLPQATAVLHEQVAMDSLSEFFARPYEAVSQALAAQGTSPAGPPFGYYHGMPGETVDVEAGFPVAEPIQPHNGVVPNSLPGGRAVESVHVGPYDTLSQTYDEVQRRIEADGLEPAPDMWESYLSDPEAEPDPATWRTRIDWPVR